MNPASWAAQTVRTTSAPEPPWVDRPMRWAQLTLVENDPATFDLGFWLAYFKHTHSDAACLSAGGCVAYYPTAVPFHHRSVWRGDRDVFGEFVPIGRQQVRVKLPEGKRAKAIRLLVSGRRPDARVGNGHANLVVPGIVDHEVVAVDLA